MLSDLHYNANRQSSAVGLSEAKALVRAGNEGYEKCAAAVCGNEYYITATREEIGPNAIPNTSLFPLSVEENAPGNRICSLPDTTPAAWTPVWSLTYSKLRWVLMAYCHLGFPEDQAYAVAHSRGLAAGPGLEFCILKGIAELYESLSITRWKCHQSAMPAVNLAHLNDPVLAEIQALHKSKGRTIRVLDISYDPMLPLFVFVVISHDRKRNNLIMGFGTHYKAQHAMRSAFLECTQMLPNLELDPNQLTSSINIAFKSEKYHFSSDDEHTWAHYVERESSAITLWQLVSRLKEKGIEVLVKDLTRQEVPIYASRVIFCIDKPA